MKKLYYSFIVLFLLFPLQLLSSENLTSLYTSQEFKALDIASVHTILDEFERTDPDKNIIFYIHGRKEDIHKEWTQLAVFEQNYNVKVFMLSWPSWINLFSRPVENARKSAPELAKVFDQIKTYKEEYPERFAAKHINFLTHSMGHLLIEEYLNTQHYPTRLTVYPGKKLFTNYISNGADTDLLSHKTWLNWLDFAQKKYVTMNNGDSVLILSSLLNSKQHNPFPVRMGLGFSRFFSFSDDMIPNLIDPSSTYLDFSKVLTSEHRYFASDKPIMRKIFTTLFNGKTFESVAEDYNYKQEYGIYYLKK